MRIRITKNTKPLSWYKDLVGEEFEVLSTNEEKKHYIVEEGRITQKFVMFEDCEVISKEDSV